MSAKKAVIAMSGGVDSTVAALLAAQVGYELTAVNLKLFPDTETDPQLLESCRKLGIELVVRDCTVNFYSKVLRFSAEEYANARTPNPCCECNALLKFRELFAAADELGIDKVLTGHYAKISVSPNNTSQIVPAADRHKDQSYFLYRLTCADLARIGFPLGDLTKEEVRDLAAQAGLPCAVRPDSQDACFQIPGESCGDTLSRICKLSGKAGNFIYRGRIVGRHHGLHRFTIGQRQGLGVALGVPAYVSRIDAASGHITLCTDQTELNCSEFNIGRCVWQSPEPPGPEQELTVRVRYRSRGVKCRCITLGENSAKIRLDEPLRAVTPGQSAVFYQDGILLGGGVITSDIQ